MMVATLLLFSDCILDLEDFSLAFTDFIVFEHELFRLIMLLILAWRGFLSLFLLKDLMEFFMVIVRSVLIMPVYPNF